MNLSDLPVGSIVVDKRASWEFKTGNMYTGSGNIRPIEWIVIAHNHYGTGSTLLWSKDIVAKYNYHGTSLSTSRTTWDDTTDLRKFLRSTFYNALSGEFRSYIIPCTTKTHTYTTTDETIFILAQPEMNGGTGDVEPGGDYGAIIPYFDGTASKWMVSDASFNEMGTPKETYMTRTHSDYDPNRYSKYWEQSNLYFTRMATDYYSGRAGVRVATNFNSNYPVSSSPDANGVYELTGFIKRHLFNDSNNIKTFDGTSWNTVGVAPATESMFLNYGVSSLSFLTRDIVSQLSDSTPSLLTYTQDINKVNANLNMTSITDGQLALPTGDISIQTVDSFDDVTVTGNIGGAGNVRIIISVDKGVTWKTYDSVNLAWVDINHKDLSIVKTNGLSIANFNNLTGADFNNLVGTSNVIRFGYYLEQNASTDVANVDNLSMQFDMKGDWKPAQKGADYTYRYETNKKLSVSLYINGDFKINTDDLGYVE